MNERYTLSNIQTKMETAIQVFNNPQFGKIRGMYDENGQIFFVGKDVARALGYSAPRNAIKTHVDRDDALKQCIIDSRGRDQMTTLINESGLYSLILSSKLPQAKAFKRWVTSEVLPAIRKSGAYAVVSKDIIPPVEQPKQLPDKVTLQADKLLRKHVNAFNRRLKEYTSEGRYFLGAGYGPASREQSGIVLAPGLTFEQSLKSLFGQLDEAFLMFFSRNYGIAKGETAMQLRMEAMRNQIALLGKMAGVL